MKTRAQQGFSIRSAVVVTALAAAQICIGAEVPATSRGWTHWRGPKYNGISGESNWQAVWPAQGPKRSWQVSVGTGFSSIAVSGGRVFTMGNINDRDIIYSLDSENGQVVWKHSYPCPKDGKNHEGGPSATPTVDANMVYTFSRKGDLFCLNAGSGQLVWSKNLHKALGLKPPTWGFASSPLVVGNMVILNAGTAGVALKKTNGEVVWTTGAGVAGYATALPFTVGNKSCVAVFGGEGIYGLSAADGKQLWQYPWKTSYDVNAADPIITGDKVFISSGYNKGCTLLRIGANGPEVVWENKEMRNHFNSCILWEGNIYGFDESELKCLDFETGKARWAQEGLGKGSLMAADGKLIILSEGGELVIAQASPESFKELSRASILKGRCWTVPVLAGGRIYARNAVGDLVCVDVQAN